MSSPQPHATPARFGRYEVVSKLAAGGMATVYVGRAVATAGFERLVAIKACHPHLLDDGDFRTMFFDEARLAALIHHPNVVATLDVADDQDGLYLVMEYVEGVRLVDLVREAAQRKEVVPVPIILRIMLDALRGLNAAHNAQSPQGQRLHLVHRDVSPQNLVVGVDGSTRVVDFGVAKAEARLTATTGSATKGKIRYMSPEHLQGREVSARSDVFAAGVVLWEALTGQRMFDGTSHGDIAQKILYVPMVAPSRRGAAAELDAPVMQALQRDPEQRFPTASAFAEALENAGATIARPEEVSEYVSTHFSDQLETVRARVREHPVSGRFPSSQPAVEAHAPAPAPAPAKSRRLIGLVAVLVSVLVALGAWGAFSTGGQPSEAIKSVQTDTDETDDEVPEPGATEDVPPETTETAQQDEPAVTRPRRPRRPRRHTKMRDAPREFAPSTI